MKNPTHVKEEKNKNLSTMAEEGESAIVKRSYPKDKAGNSDEWAALLKNQNDAAIQMHKTMVKNKRELLTAEYGKKEYLQGLARKKETQIEQLTKALADRQVTDDKFRAFQDESIRRKEIKIKQKKQYGEEVEIQVKQSVEMHK